MGYNYDIRSKTFWDEQEVHQERVRVFDLCHSCRRCLPLCKSFPRLFDLIDERDGDVSRLTETEHREIVALCFQCKICGFIHCPYTPPHEWMIDFPRLMLRSKAAWSKEGGLPLRDHLLGNTDLIGRLGSAAAPVFNRLQRVPFVRVAVEKTIGIHRDRILPDFAVTSFRSWFRDRKAKTPSPARQVVLFHSCFHNNHETSAAIATVEVLEKNGIGCIVPDQQCCGMPYLGEGGVEEAGRKAEFNLRVLEPFAERGIDIVSPLPTCSLMLKKEYPTLLPGEASHRVSERTFDICEYLMKLHAKGELNTSFTKPIGKIVYQIPCHLRDQNIGLKSRDLMRLVPGTEVEVVERCSGIDGTWGYKKEYFDLSLQIGKRLFSEITEGQPAIAASDCGLACQQIRQGTGLMAFHPIEIIRRAYGD